MEIRKVIMDSDQASFNGDSKSQSQEKVMTAQEVSAYLKIPLSTLYGLTKRGRIKGAKVGKHWRYLEKDIHSFLVSPSSFRSQSFHDRRLHPRINCEVPTELKVLLDRREESLKKGTIYNLSESGAFFSDGTSGAKVQVGDPVRVVFRLETGKSNPIEITGRVVHLAPARASSFGIKFKNMTLEEREIIRNYVG